MYEGYPLQAVGEPYHIQGSVFAHRATLGGSVAQMIAGAANQAEAQYGKPPTVCLLSGWDYQKFIGDSCLPENVPAKIDNPVMFKSVLQLVPVYSLLPGNCVVGWPEGEAPEYGKGTYGSTEEELDTLKERDGLASRNVAEIATIRTARAL